MTLAFLVSGSPTSYVLGFALTAFLTPAYGAFPSTLDGYALALSALTFPLPRASGVLKKEAFKGVPRLKSILPSSTALPSPTIHMGIPVLIRVGQGGIPIPSSFALASFMPDFLEVEMSPMMLVTFMRKNFTLARKGKTKKQFFLEALQPNHQRSLPAGHFTNVSQVKGEPTSFNWCSQPRVKGSRFVEKVKARSPVKMFFHSWERPQMLQSLARLESFGNLLLFCQSIKHLATRRRALFLGQDPGFFHIFSCAQVSASKQSSRFSSRTRWSCFFISRGKSSSRWSSGLSHQSSKGRTSQLPQVRSIRIRLIRWTHSLGFSICFVPSPRKQESYGSNSKSRQHTIVKESPRKGQVGHRADPSACRLLVEPPVHIDIDRGRGLKRPNDTCRLPFPLPGSRFYSREGRLMLINLYSSIPSGDPEKRRPSSFDMKRSLPCLVISRKLAYYLLLVPFPLSLGKCGNKVKEETFRNNSTKDTFGVDMAGGVIDDRLSLADSFLGHSLLDIWLENGYDGKMSWNKLFSVRQNLICPSAGRLVRPIQALKNGEILLMCSLHELVAYNIKSNMQHFFASVDKAKSVLGWKPEFDLIEGLADSYNLDFGRGTFRKAADFTTDDMILSKNLVLQS
ncbi:hypothetical protein IFM89_017015 [Coptis chinensis]|uniref:Uncharacterized protein n=1 Tax=Coptis chinensis TaxID=261450 RepID=A0A835HKP0_9MAGN|nr:hypothetical protein IFM89_017015 [Coptis chinensis]